MGVHGLWKLIEASGKPIPIETLENKVLAVDVSIWLHQAIKGFQDSKGGTVANAHLLGIYHRVCKLLYFKIKPVFVFDGGVPALKRQTITKRNQQKSRNISEADRLQKQLLSTLLKHSAISKVLSEKAKASLAISIPKKTSSNYDSLYALPSSSTDFDSTLSTSESEDEDTNTSTTNSSPTKQWDLHTIDTTSPYFKSLPLEVKHEVLTDLKETRKQNTWAKLHLFPKKSDDFSTYQMKRLLKRQEVQFALEEVTKEMGGTSLSLSELESLLKDQGIKTIDDNAIGKRIASDINTKILYIKSLQEEQKKAEEAVKNKEKNIEEEKEMEKAIQLSLEVPEEPKQSDKIKKSKADLEEEEDLRKAIQLSLEETPSTSTDTDALFLKYVPIESQSDSDSDLGEEIKSSSSKKISCAQSYMMEYSGLSHNEINKIIKSNSTPNLKGIKSKEHDDNTIKRSLDKESFTNFKETKDLTTIAEENENFIEEEVELMSDSDDSSNDEESPNKSISNSVQFKSKNPLEIIINPNQSLNESDDLFKDIFEGPNHSQTTEINKQEETIVNKNKEDIKYENKPAKKAKGPFEIIINPKQSLDESDDLFKDIFSQPNLLKTNESNKQEKDIVKEKPKNLEIIINPKEPKDEKDNLFDDIFTETKPPEDQKEFTQKEIFGEKINAEVKENSREIEFQIVPKNTEDNLNDPIYEDKLEEVSINKVENSIQSTNNSAQVLNNQNLEKLLKDLEVEKLELIKEKSTKERLGNNISDQMYQEAQELLELFGVPYLVAPMEAEAQCAFLDEIELTNGTITDDSDIWLFGGRTVYKNFFNQSKYVMEFKSENIEHHFKLTRKQMILLALLVGSDYTTGLQGVGPVTALEILSCFPPSNSDEIKLTHNQLVSGLRDFKSWFLKGKTAGPGRSALKNKLKNVTFSEGFPNLQVVEAYLDPKVDTNKGAFSWGKPDVTGLTVFAKEKFGWTMKKTEEILNPVIKKMEENQTQKSIKEYFQTKFKATSIDLENKVSKRVKTAIDRIGKTPDDLIAEEMEELQKEKEKELRKSSKIPESISTKIKNKKSETGQKINDSNLNEVDNNDNGNKKPKKKEVKQTKNIKQTSKTDATSELVINDKSNVKKRSNKRADTVSEPKKMLQELDDIKDYENLAMQLKTRRRKRENLIKNEEPSKKKTKLNKPQLENIPKELENDEEIKILQATTSKSNEIVESIKNEAIKSLEKISTKGKPVITNTNLHSKEIIHQRLKDKTDSLKEKLKAIEVFRKSTKGPGYVPKRSKTILKPKEDAELSEESD